MRLISRILAFVAVLVLATGPLATPQALAGPRDAVLVTRKADPYASVPTVFDFQRGVYKVNGQRFASFKAINGAGSWLGSEAVPNGSFDTDLSGWDATPSAPPSTVTWAAGKAVASTDGTNPARLRRSFPTVAGRTYQATLETTGGTWAVSTSGGGSDLLPYVSSGAPRTFVASGSATWINLTTLTNGTTWDNVSVREVVSTPAPELIRNGGFDSDTLWTKSQATISGGVATVTSPDGSYAAVTQAVPTTVGRTYRIAATINLQSGFGAIIGLGGVGDLTTKSSLGSETLSTTFIASAPSVTVEFKRRGGGGASTFTVDNVSVTEVVPVATVSRASDGYAQGSDGVWRRFGPNEARITDQGLLIEEARTNTIPNSAGVGAVAGVIGSGGALPSGGWGRTVPSGGGQVAQVVGQYVGSDGLTYTRIRFSGTNASGATATVRLNLVNTTLVATTGGQVWTGSASILVRNITGVTAGGFKLQTVSADGAGATLSTNSGANLPVSTTPVRQVVTHTAHASAVFVTLRLESSVPDATAYDVEFDVAAGQLELGAFATSPIVTTGAAATRAADQVYVTGLPQPATFTLFTDVDLGTSSLDGTNRRFAALTDGTANSRFVLYRNQTNGAQASMTVGGTASFGGTVSGMSGVTRIRAAAYYDGTNYKPSVNGTLAAANASALPPLGRLDFGEWLVSGGGWLNGYVRRVLFWPRVLTDDELKGASNQSVPLAANDDRALWEAA